MDSSKAFDESIFLRDSGSKISNILRLESEILSHLRVDTEFSSGTPTLNSAKLDSLTSLTREMFSDLTHVSDKLHTVAESINPSFTRLSSFHLNECTRLNNFDFFSYSLPLELQVYSQLSRLQDHFLSGL